MNIQSGREGSSCPECGTATQLIDAEVVCPDCGLVISDEEFDYGPGRARFDDEQTQRTGPPQNTSRPDNGFSHTLRFARKDGYGNTLDTKKQRQLGRLRRRARYETGESTQDVFAFNEIRRVTTAIGAGKSVQELSTRIFEEAQEEGLLKGRSVEAVVGASVYAAHRIIEGGVQPSLVADVSKVAEQDVRRAYNSLNSDLALPIPPPEPASFVSRAASELEGDTNELRANALQLLDRLSDARLVGNGRNPRAVAGAALAATTPRWNKPHSTDVAEVLDVHGESIRQTRKSLFDEVTSQDHQDTATG